MKYIFILFAFFLIGCKKNVHIEQQGILLQDFLDRISKNYQKNYIDSTSCNQRNLYGEQDELKQFFKSTDPYYIDIGIDKRNGLLCSDRVEQNINYADFSKKRYESNDNIYSTRLKMQFKYNNKIIEIEPSCSIITDTIILNNQTYRKMIELYYNNDTLLYFHGAFFFKEKD